VDARRLSASIVVDRPPLAVYELVADLRHMGDWSPECVSCAWVDEQGPAVGAKFVGTNAVDGREWTVECEVVAATPGQEFAWVTSGGTRWSYSFTPAGDGTEVTETWLMPGSSQEMFLERFGDKGQGLIAERQAAAERGLPATLAALKATAESVA
jgi:uncharacterized protein YndB with AHSA1/START domain